MQLPKVFLSIPVQITMILFLFFNTLYALEALEPTVQYYTQIVRTWKEQDSVVTKGYRAPIEQIALQLPQETKLALLTELATIISDSDTPQLEQLYLKAATARRLHLLQPYLPDSTQIVYSAHRVWTQIYNDNANEAGGDLVLLTMKGGLAIPTVLVSGQTRDPDVSFDAKKVLYAFRDVAKGKRSYNLYEIELSTRDIRQITSGVLHLIPDIIPMLTGFTFQTMISCSVQPV